MANKSLLQEMKVEAAKNNDALLYNAINSYEKNPKPEVLLRVIQSQQTTINELIKKSYK